MSYTPVMPPRDNRPAGDRCDVTLRDHFAAAAFPCCHEEIYREGQLQGYAPDWREQIVRQAFAYADAMLRERDSRTGQKLSKSDSSRAVCPERESTNHDAAPAARASEATASPERACVRSDAGTGGTKVGVSATGAESGSTPDARGFGRSNEFPCQPFDSAPTTDEWISYNANDYVRVKLTDHGRALLKKQHEHLNAVTTFLPYRPPVEDEDGWSKWQIHRLMNHFGAHTRMGMPLCFETTIQFDANRIKQNDAATGEPGGGVGVSPGSRTGQINRTPERESPRRECGESPLRDVPQPDNGRAAGGPEHHISGAEIDALEFVVEEGRIANIHDYGILRSLLIRLRQEWEFRDSPEPIKDDISDRPEPITIDLSQPCMVDPPSGWKWGFPRRYDPAEDGPMKEWLIRNGYPKHLADKGLTCTFTLCDKETTDK